VPASAGTLQTYLSTPRSVGTIGRVTNTDATPPAWHPDPFRRHELRWWDGNRWTEHVSTSGTTQLDPPTPAPEVPSTLEGQDTGYFRKDNADRIREQVQQKAGAVAAFAGGGSLFTEPILVVNQKAKLIEINNEYAVFDQHGRQLGAVREVGQTTAKKVVRALTRYDQYMTHRLQLVDTAGTVQMNLTRPAKFVKSKIVVTDAADREIGTIVQQNMIGKINFGLESGGHQWGAIKAENWRQWNFRIEDHTGVEIARITKTWEGVAKAMFTTADNYVIHIHRPLEDPLRALVVASAVSVDTALKQDS
jgi:uncharacterized protein YxjI